jgi:hypothetical protein
MCSDDIWVSKIQILSPVRQFRYVFCIMILMSYIDRYRRLGPTKKIKIYSAASHRQARRFAEGCNQG